jgi:chemotaxis protein methyltransferase CheR
MRDADCVAFLQWALPRLELRWRGFRKVRGQVCKRIHRRLRELGLGDVAAYRAHLEEHPGEWGVLDGLCRIPISRFYRDRGLFDRLASDVLPDLVRRADGELSCWSAGCASGEEPYTLTVLWNLALADRFPDVTLRVVATDADPHLLERARTGRYRWSSLKELPPGWVARAFTRSEGSYSIRPQYKEGVQFEHQDIRTEVPDGPFHLVLCRYLVFTYFEESLQRRVFHEIAKRLTPGGLLAIGRHESLPRGDIGLSPCAAGVGEVLYRRPWEAS